ncbi:hypothetical protein GCM10028809_40330 [Spirosoma gilvum]
MPDKIVQLVVFKLYVGTIERIREKIKIILFFYNLIQLTLGDRFIEWSFNFLYDLSRLGIVQNNKSPSSLL